ncbi:GGDEF domain-containing protein [Nodosilinea sp. LEGE 06152]|uniref:diguanylate cyclase n=1 Tax=Nodosilinea sp. LEGE 06152 TaxID=2777966 RepID=UPI001881D4A8|nr:diguanylate cyclase [Nodosilinea sp. LEGE 06152]MBE9157222.1 GGDEF domain-containing protein [Nodosilinea sp. LEGE 06152]MBE9160453.1 GGDEF domain-containing protein [Nodosilinea sp. LEGE 06152]
MSVDSDQGSSEPPVDLDSRYQYRIFLGIEHQQNQQLLAKLLGQFYSLQTSPIDVRSWGSAYDLCIFDSLFLGRFKERIAAQREAASPVFLPFLLLLKRAHLPLLTPSLRQQVDDVITMPVDQTELLLRVESLLRARQQALKLSALLAQEQLLEQQILADNQVLQAMAVQDSLTGISNRRAFDDKLAYEWKLGRREQTSLAVVLCDVDHFKAYNDTYGHVLGDQCLRAIAGVLDTVIRRPADMAARYGGEEFALVLPNTDREGAMHILNRIRRTLKARAIPHQNSPTSPYVSFSVGMAVAVPSDTIQPDDLVRAADAALYQAKAAGRDRAVVAPALDGG